MSIKALIFLIIIPLKTVIMETPFNYIKSINSMAITEKKNEADRQEHVGSKSRNNCGPVMEFRWAVNCKGKKEKSPVTCCNKRSAMCYMYVMCCYFQI